MPSPIINLLGEIVIQIRDIDQEAHQEYRWYELYDKIFNYIVQISPEKNTLTVSPQWKVQREAFDRPLRLDNPDADSDSALGDASMQTTASFLAEIIHQDDIVEPIEPKLKLEARLPDFLVFRIDSRRDVLLLVEIKSEDSEEPQKALLSIFLQAEIQAKFAFERWPSHTIIFALLIKGTKFFMHQFKKASLLPLPHHNLNKNTRYTDHMPYQEDNCDTMEPVGVTAVLVPPSQDWMDVFVEKRVRESEEYLPPFEKFSKEFKKAMDEVMDAHRLRRLQWED